MLVQFWMVTWFLQVGQINSDPFTALLQFERVERRILFVATFSNPVKWSKWNLFYYLIIRVKGKRQQEKAISRSILQKASLTLMLCYVFIYLFFITTDDSSDGCLFERFFVLCIFKFRNIFCHGLWWRWQLLNVCLNMHSSNLTVFPAPHYQTDAAGINTFC